ncbi:hypothetical protein DL96DRAFT_216938 [Flagelloscypha sp. PMI_526]|nr:hypothetical protein DL96DRAFT_216938 [Flagelloscypha sp. PMI_526]
MFTRCLRQSLPSVTRTQRPFTSTAVALAKKKKKKAAALLADEDDYDSELFGLPSEDNDLSSDLFSNSAASTLDAQLPKKARPTAEERLNLRTQLFAKQFAFFRSRIEGAVATGGNPEKIREDIPHVQLRKGNESTVQDGGGQLRPRMLEELIDLCSNPQELRQITALFPTLRTLVTKNSLSLAHKRVCGQIHGAEKETAPFTENWYKAWIPKKLVVTAGRVGAPDVAVEILTNPLEFHIPSTVPVLRQLLHDVQKVNGNDMDSLKPLIPYITNYLRADPVLSTILLQSLYASAESQIRSIPGAVLRKWAPEFAAGTKVETGRGCSSPHSCTTTNPHPCPHSSSQTSQSRRRDVEAVGKTRFGRSESSCTCGRKGVDLG